MTVIPASRLCPSDLAHLGNNVGPAIHRDREQLAAVARSLAVHEPDVDVDDQLASPRR
jgi:hypothetical protein